MKPLKQRELMKCCACKRGVMHDRSITFFRVALTSYLVNLPAVQRQHGLELAFSPASFLAGVMGPDEDMAIPVAECKTVHVCSSCAMQHSVAEIHEFANADEASTIRNDR